MGILSNIYNHIALLSPRIEVKLRQLYWRNYQKLGKYNPNRSTAASQSENNVQNKVDFEQILQQLRDWGVGKGSLLIVHSSFDSLSKTGLSPVEIISKLRELIGETGTLAMPVIRTYKEEPSAIKRLMDGVVCPICTYNVKRTPVQSGLLPIFLMRTPGAEVSMHPLNPLCAVGPLAKEMMVGNIEGEETSPHGPNSAWKFCLDHNAYICGLGTDLRHHNTIGHVAEEAFGDWYWSDEQWYDKRDFIIELPKQEPFTITVKERKPKWGMLHQSEMNRYHDFLRAGVVKSKTFESILVEFEESQKLISYLRSRNKKGYPYFE